MHGSAMLTLGIYPWSSPLSASIEPVEAGTPAWVEAFHRGERRVLAELYGDHFNTVAAAVGSILTGADRENVIHDVFLSLLESRSLRENFTGGSFSAWLRTVARNRAVDAYRKQRRRLELDRDLVEQEDAEPVEGIDSRAEAILVNKLMARFKNECIPPKWHAVFEACFVQQLSQRDAARKLGMHRTTLAYQESRIRAALKKFILRTDAGVINA